MPANFVKGDILDEAAADSGKRALVFGASSGIAVAVKKRWPGVASALDLPNGSGEKVIDPGEVVEWHDGELFVFALGIQRGEGKPKVPWIERSLRQAIERATANDVRRVLVPRLAGDWTRVKKLLGEIGASTTIDLVVFEQFIRKPAT